MRATKFGNAAACLTVFLLSSDVGATKWSNQSGNSCVLYAPSYSSQLYYADTLGAYNGGSDPAGTVSVVCPMQWVENSTNGLKASAVYVFYRDGNLSAAVVCSVSYVDEDLNYYSGNPEYSCGSNGGGCTTNSSPSYYTVSPPVENYLTLTPPTQEYLGNGSIVCDIPEIGTGTHGWFSSIMGYMTVYDETY